MCLILNNYSEKMEIYIGTSGWKYSWNPDGLKWYVEHSGFNAVELNMSFYSFPREKQVENWKKVGSSLRWAIKVHRSITHIRRLNEKSLQVWKRFRERFRYLEGSIDFYLFQLPPSLTFNETVFKRLVSYSKLCEKIALEPRNKTWFKAEVVKSVSELGIYIVTPDSPLYEGLPDIGVIVSKDTVYIRMHGRLTWYNYGYLDEELEEVAEKIINAKPKKAYVFFNNNHDMLGDGRRLKEIILEKIGKSNQ